MVLVIYGYGGLGQTYLDFARLINQQMSKWDDIVFADDAVTEKFRMGVPALTYEELLEKYPPSPKTEVIMGIGEPSIRNAVCQKLQSAGYRFTRLIHPNAEISPSAVIEDGSVIGNCVIGPLVHIGGHSFIGNRVTIGHHASVGEHSSIVDGSFIGGFTKVGNMVYIGANATLKDRISIGDHAAVAMGAAVFKDVPEGFTAFGNPARNLRRGDEAKLF